jgi:hypothetical protein
VLFTIVWILQIQVQWLFYGFWHQYNLQLESLCSTKLQHLPNSEKEVFTPCLRWRNIKRTLYSFLIFENEVLLDFLLETEGLRKSLLASEFKIKGIEYRFSKTWKTKSTALYFCYKKPKNYKIITLCFHYFKKENKIVMEILQYFILSYNTKHCGDKYWFLAQKHDFMEQCVFSWSQNIKYCRWYCFSPRNERYCVWMQAMFLEIHQTPRWT